MKLNTIDIARLLPSFLREDKNYQAFCEALNDEIKLLYEQTKLVQLYSNLYNLPEEVLDELAWQFNAIEYNKSYSIDIKRELIRNCLITHHMRGTVASVEDTAAKIFGNATVQEWFQYGGEPYHFKVHTETVTVTDEMIEEFHRVIRETQNIRSWLQEVITETMDSMDLFVAPVLIVSEDITLYTEDEPISSFMYAELYISNGALSFEPTVFPVQNQVFTDRTTGYTYTIEYDNARNSIGIVRADDAEGAQDALVLTDTETGQVYEVFVDEGRLCYAYPKAVLGEAILDYTTIL